MTILLGVSSSLQHSTPQEWAAKHVELGLKCVNFPVDYLAGEDVYMAYKKAADDAGLVIAEVGVWRNMITSPQRYFYNDDFLRECFTKLGPWIVSCHLKDILLKQEYNPEMPFIIEHLVTDEEYIQSINYVQNLMK